MRLGTGRFLPAVAIVGIAGVVAAGCGGGDGGTTASETTSDPGSSAAAGGEAGGATVVIKMGEFFFKPKNATATAGLTTVEAPNEGKTEHELVLFKTDMNPAKLPTNSSGEVEEEKLDKLAETPGEIPDVEAGDTKSADLELTPGKYVMFCNLPGHYAAGMYGTLTVTE
ncbi:MAG TPA: plastocyanin/azurin family copper-binding protein [Solirubrobacterales bacterium]|jgi:uncharacterized cupredoxin-like copper-binding protein|nr:plastocyanin/azurin family copper-binding protein [Solirubrobacterales bacterium]